MTVLDSAARIPGYFDSPWPGEDGGPRRQMIPRSPGLGLQPDETLEVVTRAAPFGCMPILRSSGEVYVQGNAPPSAETTAWVESIDPESLVTRRRSPDLAGGPFWPGGMLAHQNGDLYVTFGRWCHRLDPDCRPVASRALPRAMPYNSLLALSDGNVVMKNFVRDGSSPSYFTILEPERLEPVSPEVAIPEGSIARISSDIEGEAEFVYVVGDHTFFRYRYEAGALTLDDSWSYLYRVLPDGEQSYGWDPVLTDGYAWFLDNGDNIYRGHFRGGGVATSPLRLHRVGLSDSNDYEAFPPFDAPHGTVANPPLVDASRKIAVAFDSGNSRIAALSYAAGGFDRIWEHSFGAGNHFILFPDTGEIVVNDHDGASEHVVVLDIESGVEKGRVGTGSAFQSVVFQSPGWQRDIYTCTFSTLSRTYVA